MKTFIYFSQGEWRTFQAEELPVKPESGPPSMIRGYAAKIAALKAKAIPVGNSEILEKVSLAEARIVETSVPILEWPGTVEVKEHTPLGCETWADMEFIAILKLPEKSKPIA